MITTGYIESHPQLFKVCMNCGNIYKKSYNSECDCGTHDYSVEPIEVTQQIEYLRNYWVNDEKEMSEEAFECMTIVTTEE